MPNETVSLSASANYVYPISALAKAKSVLGPEFTKKRPTLVDLFGSFDLCDCKHCRSVLSPAAYFVDLLQFLNPPVGKKPLDVLLKRRPDLEHIQLTCENTNTPLPYVDLVNEILEAYVALGSLEKMAVGNTGDTTAEELAANPQDTNPAAYKKLRDAVYPLSLPYVQPLEVARVYLEHLGSSLHQVMETFQTATGPTDLQVACEYLKISPEERAVLTGQNPAPLGSVAALERVPDFLRQTGLSYLDLIELVKARFINPLQGTPQQLSLDTPTEVEDPPGSGIMVHVDPCDLTHTRIKNLDEAVLGRMHRFIRLWRRLALSMADLDREMTALKATDINTGFLGNLALVKRLQGDVKRPLLDLLSLWSEIDTHGESSLFKKLFQAKAVQEIDPKFNNEELQEVLQDIAKENIKDHVPALLAAFRLSAGDFDLIRADAQLEDDLDADPPKIWNLSLTNLSTLYRYTVLARMLKWPVKDVITLKTLSGVEPFASPEMTLVFPEMTLVFIELARKVRQSGLSLAQLNYIYRHVSDPPTNLAPQRTNLRLLAKNLRDGLVRITQENTLVEGQEDPQGELTRTKLGMIFEPPIVDQIIRLLDGTASYSAPLATDPGDIFPESLKNKIAFDKAAKLLRFTGQMSETERDLLVGLQGGSEYQTAVEAIFRQPRTLIADTLSGILAPGASPDAIAAAVETALNHLLDNEPLPSTGQPLTVSGKFLYVLERLLPYLRTTLSRSFVKQTVADTLGLESAMAALLLEHLGATASMDRFLDLAKHGLSARYFKSPHLPDLPDPIDPPAVAFGGAASVAPADTKSARYTGLLLAPNNGSYTFSLSPTSATALLVVGDSELVMASPQTEWAPIPLKAGELYDIRLELEGLSDPATVELSWRSGTIAKDRIPSANLCPGDVVVAFENAFTRLHKIAMLVNAFKLTAKEVAYLQAHGSDFKGVDPGNASLTADFDLGALPLTPSEAKPALFAQWQRLYDVVSLRNGLPHGEVSLVDVFGADSLDDAKNRLVDLTGWDLDQLSHLIDGFTLAPTDLKNEVELILLEACFRLMKRLGASAAQLFTWAADLLDPATAHAIAQDIKRTVKAKYDEEQWLAVARPLSDRLRESQRAALVDYVLADPTIVAQNITNANQLFEYFLIDVNMSPCFMTSRIKQAISSVQLFVQRCLMNLEPLVSLQEDAADQWEWRKNYRVWEANRKVFLWPENWILPELRDDKSPFFEELESQLLQSDVTEESAEQALLQYLEKLDGVARLEIVGLHVDKGSWAIHVFGRTFNPPNVYYYRRLDLATGVWTPWEKVNLDIQGDPEGVHLVPVVFNRRLYLFWPIFEKKRQEDSGKDARERMEKWAEGVDSYSEKVKTWRADAGQVSHAVDSPPPYLYDADSDPTDQAKYWANLTRQYRDLFSPDALHKEFYRPPHPEPLDPPSGGSSADVNDEIKEWATGVESNFENVKTWLAEAKKLSDRVDKISVWFWDWYSGKFEAHPADVPDAEFQWAHVVDPNTGWLMRPATANWPVQAQYWFNRAHEYRTLLKQHPGAPDPAPEKQDYEPVDYWEIKLAWSEYKGNKWLPKQVSPTALESKPILLELTEGYLPEKRHHVFRWRIAGPELGVTVGRAVITSALPAQKPVHLTRERLGAFVLGDCGGKLHVVGQTQSWYGVNVPRPEEAENRFQSFAAVHDATRLTLKAGTVMAALPGKHVKYDVLFPADLAYTIYGVSPSPFAFQDDRRCYLAMSTTETVIELLNEPDKTGWEPPQAIAIDYNLDPLISIWNPPDLATPETIVSHPGIVGH